MEGAYFRSVVTREGDTWSVAVDLPDVGDIYARADTDDDIQFMAHEDVCAYTDFEHEDFEITYSFVGGTPAWAKA